MHVYYYYYVIQCLYDVFIVWNNIKYYVCNILLNIKRFNFYFEIRIGTYNYTDDMRHGALTDLLNAFIVI